MATLTQTCSRPCACTQPPSGLHFFGRAGARQEELNGGSPQRVLLMKADEEKVVVMNEEQRGLRTELRGKNQTGLRLLLVDDEEINRYLIEQYVVGTSIELDVARDGAEGVEKACRERYDVILMDIRMPVMSGLEATRLIRSWEREHDLEPAIIVAFTASLVGEEIRFALAAGCTAHLPKPATRNDLLDLVGRLLSDRA